MHVCPDCGHSQPAPGSCPNDQTALIARGDDVLLGTSVGVYRVAKLLGVGGMGRVYKGVHPQIGSRVAIKVLSRECADREDLVERFFSEARAVNLIRHESIVNVLDLAQLPDGRPYIIMEYLDGAPLADLVGKLGPLPLGGLAKLIAEVLDALAAAHAKGIVHRDLKPDNIYVTPAGRPKVLDFGIAKLRPELGGSATQTGSLLGTPHYMSPEQALGKPVDLRTDVYAIGVILFECATGRRPFVGDSLFDLLRRQVDEAPPSPRQFRPDMPPALEQVILYALSKDPNHRFASAPDLANALMQSVQQLPPEQWTPITPSSLQRISAQAGAVSGAGWSGTPASWPPGTPRPGTPMPGGTPSQPWGPGTPPPMQGMPPGYPPGPGYQQPSSVSAAGQVVPQRPQRSNKGLLFAIAGVCVIGGGIGVALAVSGAGGGGSTSAGSGSAVGSGSDQMPPTTIEGSGSAGSGSAGSGSAGSGSADGDGDGDTDLALDDETAERLRKLEEAAAALEALDTTRLNGGGVKPLTGGGSGSGSSAGSSTVGSAKPAGGDDLARRVAAYSSGIPACDDYVRVMFAAANCDKFEGQASGMRDGVAAMMNGWGQLKNLPADSRKQAQDAADPQCRDAAKQMRGVLKQFACDAPPAPKLPPLEAPDPDTASAPVEVEDEPEPPDARPTAPYNIRIPNFNPSAFDFMAWLPAATAEARKVLPDAVLTRLDADGVGPDGLAHLTVVPDDWQVLYRFVSPSAAKQPPDHPKGVKWEPLCMVQIFVQPKEINVIPMKGFGCEKPIPKPKCNAKQIWQKAIDGGAPSSNAYAELWYGYAGNKWSFDIGDDFSESFVDGC